MCRIVAAILVAGPVPARAAGGTGTPKLAAMAEALFWIGARRRVPTALDPDPWVDSPPNGV